MVTLTKQERKYIIKRSDLQHLHFGTPEWGLDLIVECNEALWETIKSNHTDVWMVYKKFNTLHILGSAYRDSKVH